MSINLLIIPISQLMLACSGSMLTEHNFDYNMASYVGPITSKFRLPMLTPVLVYETCICLITYGSIRWLSKLDFSLF